MIIIYKIFQNNLYLRCVSLLEFCSNNIQTKNISRLERGSYKTSIFFNFLFLLDLHSRSISWNVELFSPDWLCCCCPPASADPPPPPALDWLEDDVVDVEVEDEVVDEDEEVLVEVVVAVVVAAWGGPCWLGTLEKTKQFFFLSISFTKKKKQFMYNDAKACTSIALLTSNVNWELPTYSEKTYL